MSQAAQFYSARRRFIELLLGTTGVSGLSYEVHGIRADATNAAAVHSAKAHVLEVLSSFAYHDEPTVKTDDGGEEYPPEERVHCVFPDLQKVFMPHAYSVLTCHCLHRGRYVLEVEVMASHHVWSVLCEAVVLSIVF
jgi:hypothetical protein